MQIGRRVSLIPNSRSNRTLGTQSGEIHASIPDAAQLLRLELFETFLLGDWGIATSPGSPLRLWRHLGMAIRRRWALAALALVLSANSAFTASFRTTNFIVDAPNEQLARQFGEAAEYYRKEKAREWLGKEMPNWQRPCPLEVRISP